MADSSDQSSGFWTLTRPSKLSKRRNSDLHELHHKVFNISVVGLSGVEKDKGPIGIGKSCLCNRFVRSAADDYHTDHISVLSQSDFSGRVVNNDHWLYWGSVIKSCDGYDLAFNVIEQSEFVDDACFQPFKSGKTEPYYKRCANTKLVSAEKLMYICKNQLGIEREYEQRYLPDGKFNVDGFLCLFDVSEVHGRNIEKQIEITNLIMLNLIKTKKPIVFVTTKNDEVNEMLVVEAERIVNQRECRGLVPIVETSAQENININMAFLVCAQLIDKTRAKLRVPPYFEAYRNHIELLNAAGDAYLGLIRSTVLDHRSSWQQICIKLSHNPEFLQYTYLHGLDKANLVFKSHIKRLRDECIGQKVQNYLKIFPDILNEMVPRTIGLIVNNNNSSEAAKTSGSGPRQSWNSIREQIRSHPLFSKYFIQLPPDINWYDTELLQSAENRIPSDWLESEEAFSVYQQRTLQLEGEQQRQNSRELFAQMLKNIRVPVGKPFVELKDIFVNTPDLGILSDKELFEVYVEYQNNLLQRGRTDFQELLLENAEHLHNLTSSNKVIRQEDIKTINAILQHDERYQALDRFDQDRTLMIIRHLSFLHSQLSEQCPSYPKCVEPEIERLLITKAKALVSKYFESKNDSKSTSSSSNPHSQKTCDLVIFGPRRPSQQLILALNVLNSKAPKASQYQITFTVFDNADEVDTQIQRFRKSDTKPKGCFGIFTNRRSLEHVSYTLEKFLILNSQIQNDKNHFGSPPIVMLYAADITLDERTMLALENEGQQMADRFKCPFMNVTAIDQYRQHQQNNILTNDQDSSSQVMSECASLDYACVDAAFNVLKEAVSRRVCFMELYNNQDLIPRQAFNPDARILMCLLCGEPFSNELIMWRMFLDYEDCYVTSSKSICLKVKLDGTQEKFIEVTITSYTHGAFDHREELLHGFILVCSMQRRASISILNAFSSNIPCTPVLVMAVKSAIIDDDCNRFSSSSSSSISANNQAPADETNVLIAEAQTTAARLKGHFELFDLTENNQSCNNNGEENGFSISRIKNFLHNVIKRKPTIEKAYESGEVDITSPATSSYDNNDYLSSKKIDDKINYKQKERTTPKQTLQSQQQQQKFQKQQQHHHNQQSLISSDDELNESNLALDKNLSDDSEAYSTTSNSALQARAAVFAKTGQEERRTTLNELYLKRPLPPPPPPPTEVYYASRELDRDVDVLPPTSDKVLGNKKFDCSKHMQASEETNDSSSEGDTEDSTEAKLDKPKPGKLDLSQFDNITNAIGKLNVKAQTKSPAVDFKSSATNSKVFTSKIMQDNSPQDSGFFKSRTRKVKGRTKDSPQREPRKSGSNDQLASLTTRERQSEVRGTSQEQSRTDANARAFGAAKTSAIYRMKSDLGEDDRLAGRGNISDRSSRNNNWNDLKPQNRLPTSSFLQNAQDNLDTPDLRLEKELPKPAPRSTAQALNSRGSAVAAGAASSSTGGSGSASGTKRLANPRQNHGRAVAPPQLPPELLSSSIGRSDGESISGGQPTNESISQITADEAGIDFSQSPIAQRLLKQSRDYKVSEINSPYESENEQSQSMNLLRSHKLYRGQSLGSENSSPNSLFNNSSIDSSELINSRGAAIRQLNEILANKQNPAYLGGTKPSINRTTSLDQDNQEQTPVAQSSTKKNDKDSKKVDKKKLRDDEKMEKRRLKEEERLRRQEKKLAAKKSKSSTAESKGSVGDDGVPLFIKRCIEFIEQEGLDAEGIYRVPGNRAHVDAFVQKFKENPYMSIVESDIPVNAVATALKDFLSKKWGPIIPLALMNELTGLSNISEKEQRVQAVRQLIKKLPTVNYKLLKYVFSHFVKVSLNHSLNSMDSKNLAICWWPTLLPLHFSDMVMFEQMRPHLEESIQTMIDQYDYIFDSEEPIAAT